MIKRQWIIRASLICGVLLVCGIARIVLSPRTSLAAPNGAMLTGSVKSDSGEKMEGVTISAKAQGTNITTSVFTDADGNYYLPELTAGKYRVWAQARGFEAGREEVEIGDSTLHQDFSLKATNDFAKQLTPDEWLAALPEDTPEHRKMKDVFINNCTACHVASYNLQNRFDEAGWTAIINLMSRTSPEGGFQGPDSAPVPVINFYKKELAAYLAEVRGPGTSPMQFKVPARPTGEATMALVKEFDVPVDADGGYGSPANNGSDWSNGTASMLNGNRGIHDAQIDFNGNIWFAYTEASRDRTVGKVDTKTGEVTNVKVPGNAGMAAASHGITIDQNGMLWFNAQGGIDYAGTGMGGNFHSLARLDPNTGKVDLFAPPQGMDVGGTLRVDAKGNVWAEMTGGAIRFDANTHEFSGYKSPSQESTHGAISTYGVAGDRDGNGWWTQFNIEVVNKVDVQTGKIESITMPDRDSRSANAVNGQERQMYSLAEIPGNSFATPWAQGPRRMDADKNGNSVWLCDYWGDNLVKVDIHTMKTTTYKVPIADAGPYTPTVDNHHNVWVNLTQGDRIAKFNPSTQQWTLYSLPTLGPELRYVSLVDRDGKVQLGVGYTRVSKVAKMEFRTKEDLQALKAQANQLNASR